MSNSHGHQSCSLSLRTSNEPTVAIRYVLVIPEAQEALIPYSTTRKCLVALWKYQSMCNEFIQGKKNKGKASELNLRKSTADMFMRKRWRRVLLDRVRYAFLDHRQAWWRETSAGKCSKARLYRSGKEVQIAERDMSDNWTFVNKSICLNAVVWTILRSWIHTRRHSSSGTYCMRAIVIIGTMCDRLRCITIFGTTAHTRTNATYTRISTEMTSIVCRGR